MRDYELTVLLRPDISEKELDKEVKSLSDIFEKQGAKVKARKDPVKKSLAYEISKYREAYYAFFVLSMMPDKVAELDKKLHLAENVIRYLLVYVG